MNLLRTIIVDDEPDGRTIIKQLLQHHFPEILIVAETASVGETLHALSAHQVQLVFMDIDLRDGTGFDVLDQARKLHFNVIFTTAYNEFAIRAFRYNAVDYLLKPIDPDEFVQAVQKSMEQVNLEVVRRQMVQLVNTSQQKSFDKITLPTSAGYVFTNTSDITRIETYGNYCFVYLSAGERLLVSKNLKEFEEMLPEPDFFRIHQSHMVNTKAVKKVTKEESDQVMMSDGTILPVSRRRKEDFFKIMLGGKS